ncbi:tetratricopeptide repeat protein [Micromonospora thermarum]|uniref:TIR domain-containing protein n=1 Tax=Micromonospora thermarum TaxID=2720024 RepID=A0ABX0Z9F5_9ACTN|nr:TIR domain-containing protein [Micromonospora thermarum]NJP33753.1 TIR domain-containing protein [Micromonospora thermarum]
MGGYDVFLSLAGPDRDDALRLAAALDREGLRVFVDDEEIPLFESITAEIEDALNASKVLVTYFSRSFPGRPACEVELTAAFLSGQREGDPTRRVVVVNPEPTVDHLHPVELADARFALMTGDTDERSLQSLAKRIKERVDVTTGTIGGVVLSDRLRWIGRETPGTLHLVGRYAETWELHSKLHRGDFTLTQDIPTGGVVTVDGLPGSGKTSLVAGYARRFGARFPGGVHWISLAGATAADVLGAYGDALRVLADSAGMEISPHTSVDHLCGEFANRIAMGRQPALWVVDDVPSGLDPALIQRLAPKAGPLLRTILIGRERPADERFPHVSVGPMTAVDAAQLLRAYRVPVLDPADRRAFDELVARLGGHALALTTVGRQLRDRQGLESFSDFVRRLDAGLVPLDAVTAVLAEVMVGLGTAARQILDVSTVCAAAPVPVAMLRQVLERAAAVSRDAAATIGDGLVELRERGLATRDGASWQVHSLVREIADTHVTAAVDRFVLAGHAASAVLDLAGKLPADGRGQLTAHAARLRADPRVGPADQEALLRLLAAHYSTWGQPHVAMTYLEEIVARGRASRSDLVDTAEACLGAGRAKRALHHLATVSTAPGAHRVGPDQVTAVATALRVELVTAQARDALGEFAAADHLWVALDAATADASLSAQSAAIRIALIRSRVIRGELAEAAARLRTLIADLAADDGAYALERLQEARIELARVQMTTNEQQEARRTARLVVEHYAAHNLADHIHARQARLVLDGAHLALGLWGLNPDPAHWRRACRSIGELLRSQRDEIGPLNLTTLATEVEYAHALLCNGLARHATALLNGTRARVAQLLGPDHPLHLHALLLAGRAAAQRADYTAALDLHDRAHRGMNRVLGPRHPQTVHALYGLGVALALTGQRGRASRIFADVRRVAPRTVGRKTDLHAQGWVAMPLVVLPSALWRTVATASRRPPEQSVAAPHDWVLAEAAGQPST